MNEDQPVHTYQTRLGCFLYEPKQYVKLNVSPPPSLAEVFLDRTTEELGEILWYIWTWFKVVFSFVCAITLVGYLL